MQDTRAYRIHDYGGPKALPLDDIPVRSPGPGQLLVNVKTAGVNPLDWKIRHGLVKYSFPMTFPAVLGCEFAGVVVTTGDGAARLHAGDRVIGLTGIGAYADSLVVGEAPLYLGVATGPNAGPFPNRRAAPREGTGRRAAGADKGRNDQVYSRTREAHVTRLQCRKA